MERWQLQQRQSLPLEAKIVLTKVRIRDWYEHFDGNVYVAFSGGADSTVLLNLVRSMYGNDVPAVFCDTGLEFPEIREFVKTFENVVWLKPKLNFREVLDKYGYPVISKEQSQYIKEYRNASPTSKMRDRRLGIYLDGSGGGNKFRGTISKKHRYLINAPFKISDVCCKIMKKQPSELYERASGRSVILGNMAADSNLRFSQYLKTGCNAFDSVRPTSKPMAFWTKEDVWTYLKSQSATMPNGCGSGVNNYCSIYDKGYERTGCVFCLYGVETINGSERLNKFQLLKRTHPKLFDYCMNELGMAEVCEYIGINISD